MLYDPSSAVTAERVSWVSRFLTVTATPGSAAPVWSLMIPDTVAEVICAEAARPQDSTRRTRKQPDACQPRAGMVAISISSESITTRSHPEALRYLVLLLRARRARSSHCPAGTRRFNSSNQFSTTLICVRADV